MRCACGSGGAVLSGLGHEAGRGPFGCPRSCSCGVLLPQSRASGPAFSMFADGSHALGLLPAGRKQEFLTLGTSVRQQNVAVGVFWCVVHGEGTHVGLPACAGTK